MERNSIKRSFIAMIIVCALALSVLCFPMAMRSTKARAESMNDVIEVKLTVSETLGQVEDTDTYIWGTFYRGIKLYENEVLFLTSSGEEIRPKISLVEDEENVVTFNNNEGETYGKLQNSDPLYTSDDHTHDFTSEAGSQSWESYDEVSHWAVCSDCGVKLQVAHRPDGEGGCKDCNAELAPNTYTFTIPDEVASTDWNENVAEIQIDFSDVCLYAGYTLSLNLKCNGKLKMEDMSEGDGGIPYNTIEIIDPDCGEGLAYDVETDGPQPIWTFTPTEDDIGSDFRTENLDGTIMIELNLEIDSDSSGILYSGDYFGTLEFSVELTVPEEESR